MALIKCTECGKEISDSAVACPHCGCKTAHAKKTEETQIILRTSWAVNLICIALDIIGAILFFPGVSKLYDYGYILFDNWAQSYSDSVVEAGRKAVIGIVLVAIGFGGSIIYKKFLDRIKANSQSGTTFAPRNESLEKTSTNSPTAPKTDERLCPRCGKVLTSDQCDMCEKKNAPIEIVDGIWICPSCGQKNLSTRTSCWRCEYQI